jgi:hypothetical protein
LENFTTAQFLLMIKILTLELFQKPILWKNNVSGCLDQR